MVALAKVAARRGGRYISHVRSEDRNFWEAIEEILTIGREARLPVQVSHIKLAMRSLWGQARRLLRSSTRRAREGIDVTADIYPYLYWQSTLTVLFPERDFENRAAAEFVLERDLAARGPASRPLRARARLRRQDRRRDRAPARRPIRRRR